MVSRNIQQHLSLIERRRKESRNIQQHLSLIERRRKESRNIQQHLSLIERRRKESRNIQQHLSLIERRRKESRNIQQHLSLIERRRKDSIKTHSNMYHSQREEGIEKKQTATFVISRENNQNLTFFYKKKNKLRDSNFYFMCSLTGGLLCLDALKHIACYKKCHILAPSF